MVHTPSATFINTKCEKSKNGHINVRMKLAYYKLLLFSYCDELKLFASPKRFQIRFESLPRPNFNFNFIPACE